MIQPRLLKVASIRNIEIMPDEWDATKANQDDELTEDTESDEDGDDIPDFDEDDDKITSLGDDESEI